MNTRMFDKLESSQDNSFTEVNLGTLYSPSPNGGRLFTPFDNSMFTFEVKQAASQQENKIEFQPVPEEVKTDVQNEKTLKYERIANAINRSKNFLIKKLSDTQFQIRMFENHNIASSYKLDTTIKDEENLYYQVLARMKSLAFIGLQQSQKQITEHASQLKVGYILTPLSTKKR